MTNDTKELLDKTGRFLIEKRGTINVKVTQKILIKPKYLIFFSYRAKVTWFVKKIFLYLKHLIYIISQTTYWLLEELESKNDYIEKNLSYVQPSKII